MSRRRLVRQTISLFTHRPVGNPIVGAGVCPVVLEVGGGVASLASHGTALPDLLGHGVVYGQLVAPAPVISKVATGSATSHTCPTVNLKDGSD